MCYCSLFGNGKRYYLISSLFYICFFFLVWESRNITGASPTLMRLRVSGWNATVPTQCSPTTWINGMCNVFSDTSTTWIKTKSYQLSVWQTIGICTVCQLPPNRRHSFGKCEFSASWRHRSATKNSIMSWWVLSETQIYFIFMSSSYCAGCPVAFGGARWS